MLSNIMCAAGLNPNLYHSDEVALPTTPPSPLPDIPANAILCGDLECFWLQLYDETSIMVEGRELDFPASCSGADMGMSCSWCGVWTPLCKTLTSAASSIREDRSSRLDCEALVSDVGAPLRAMRCVGSLEALVPDGCNISDSVDVAAHQCQTLRTPGNQSPQMPRLELSTIRDIGAAVACSWELAELLQPYLALVVELNGGSVLTFQT
jgi:hypothetical protein